MARSPTSRVLVLSPRPSQRPTARAAASVARRSSRPRCRSRLNRAGETVAARCSAAVRAQRPPWPVDARRKDAPDRSHDLVGGRRWSGGDLGSLRAGRLVSTPARRQTAAMKSRKSGWGRPGRERNSGWNCDPTKNGWSRSSMISTRRPFGEVPL